MALTNDGHEYIDSNVSLYLPASTSAFEYIDMNVEATSPYPTVLGTKPSRVRTADTVTVIATGAGTTQATYLGRVQAQDDLGTWTDLALLNWVSVAATVNAYTIDRQISADMETVDIAHVSIDIVVPNWVTPPNMPIRIVTDTP